MFRLEIEGQKFLVRFCHTRTKRRWGTTCYILDGETQEYLSAGDSKVHCNDRKKVNKDKGRRIAMSRALQGIFPGSENREKRKLFWEDYLRKMASDQANAALQEIKKFMERASISSNGHGDEYPCRCVILDVDGEEVATGITGSTPAISKPHVGKYGTAEWDDRGTVKITLDDGTVLYGFQCWWKRVENEEVKQIATQS